MHLTVKRFVILMGLLAVITPYQNCTSQNNLSALSQAVINSTRSASSSLTNGPAIKWIISPSSPTTSTTDQISFQVTVPGTPTPQLKCSIDGSTPPTDCMNSTAVALMVNIGSHTFQVFVIDSNGNLIPTPAYAWSVIPQPALPPAKSCAPGETLPGSFMPCVDVSKIPTGNPGIARESMSQTSEVPPSTDIGNFRTLCDYSHMSFSDPIVFPGVVQATHLHAFFGNTGTNAFSTSASIANSGNSTCRGGTIDRSAYWSPAMIDTNNGAPIQPRASNFYYKQGYAPGIHSTDVRPLPVGLRIIAGDSTRKVSGDSPVRYACDVAVGNDTQETWSNNIPINCPVGGVIKMAVTFPQCWDGINLDSPDHKSHMVYAMNYGGSCPASHPVVLVEMAQQIEYPVTGPTDSWRLSSDNYAPSPGNAGNSGHADFINGWEPEITATWTAKCINTSVDCHSHLLGDGRMMNEIGQ